MKTVTLPSSEVVPALGLGTWRMGEAAQRRKDETAAIALGLDLGIKLIDTAEMYGEGGAEEAVGKAIAGRRDGLFIVSKVYPHNAGRAAAIAACERSLKRLGTDRIDLYLLHWRGSVPLAETLEAFERLRRDGKIRHHGVSNFDVDDMEEWWSTPGGRNSASNQVLYNLGRRAIEHDLVPWCRKRGMPIMAYSPVEQGRLKVRPGLAEVAARHGVNPMQVAIAWLLHQDGMIVIPKATRPEHVRENRAAHDIALTAEDLAAIDRDYPRPGSKQPLAML
jgi:diketogulonate reductase-like aldo/keto reductase